MKKSFLLKSIAGLLLTAYAVSFGAASLNKNDVNIHKVNAEDPEETPFNENLYKDGDFEKTSSWEFNFLADHYEIQDGVSVEGNAIKMTGNGFVSDQRSHITSIVNNLDVGFVYALKYSIKTENVDSSFQFSTFAQSLTSGVFDYMDFVSPAVSGVTDWKEISALITIPKVGNIMKTDMRFGFVYYYGSGTVYLDNISLYKVMSAEGIGSNLSFEYDYESTPINWIYSGDGVFQSQSNIKFEKSDGEKAAKLTHISGPVPSEIKSQKIFLNNGEKCDGKTYEISYYAKTIGDYTCDFSSQFVQYNEKNNVTYSIGFNPNNPNNNYQNTGRNGDLGSEFINSPNWMYHVYGESEWRRVSFSFTPAKNTAYVILKFILLGNDAAAYFDDIQIKEAEVKTKDSGFKTINNVNENSDFEYIDEIDKKPTNWYVSNSRSYHTLLTSDDTYYKNGDRSLYLETEGTTELTTINNAALIEVNAGEIYEFSAYFSSRNCDPKTKIRMNLYYFDEKGNSVFNEYGDQLYIYGVSSMCNCGPNKDNWKQLYTRSSIPSVAKYVSFSFILTSGHAEIWLDDINLISVENDKTTEKLEFHTAFNKVDSDGNVDGFILNHKDKASIDVDLDVTRFIVYEGNDVAITRRIYSFITEYQYHFLFSYNSDSNGYIRIDFYNNRDVLVDGQSLIRTFNQDSQPIDFYFLAPSSTYAILTIGLDSPGVLNLNYLDIYQTHAPASKGLWDAQWVWYSEDAPKFPEQYRYFRYTFELADEATYAPLQFTVDDKYVLYVNGQFIDFNWDAGSDSWANVHVYMLQDYLVKGKNVIAVKAYNLVSEAGVLFDGKFTLKNGSEFKCLSTKDVKTVKQSEIVGDVNIRETAVPIWAMPEFDDSSWQNAKECGVPPTSPWGPVFYDSSLYVENEMEIVSIKSQKKIEAGKTLSFTAVLKAKNKIESSFSFTVGVVPSDTADTEENVQKANLKITSGNEDLTKWPVNEEVEVNFELVISSLLDSGWYDLRLESKVLTLSNEDIFNNRFLSFKVIETTTEQTELISSVEQYNGSSAIMINGEPKSPTLYLRPDLDVYRQTDSEDRMTNSTYELYITYQGCLGKNGQAQIMQRDPGSELGYKLDYEAFDDAIISLLNASVDGYVMVNFGMFAPSWWMNENDSEVVYSSDKDGNLLKQEGVSFSSEKWTKIAGDCLRKLIEHMTTQKYYNRVFGLRITAGQTYEFMNYGAGAKYMPDYSEASEIGFRKWVEEKYKNIETVNSVYKKAYQDFDDITIPSLVERGESKYSTLLSPNEDMWKIDYSNYLTSKSADCLLEWAHIAKEASQRKKIVGAYYGYMWTFGSYDGASSTHTGLYRILESEDIDFIASPYNYNEKIFGMSSTFMSLADTVEAYGKLYILEEDNRTFKTDGFSGVDWNGSWDYQVGETHTPQDTIYQFRRDFANNFVNGTGFWHYDMYGGWVDDPQIYDAMAQEKQIYSDAYYFEDTSYDNDVAVFVDDNTYTYFTVDLTYNSNYILNSVLMMEQRENLNRMGVGYDTYTMSSLQSGKVKPHKVNIFISPYEITSSDNEKIQEYLTNSGGYAVWIYGAGYSDGTYQTNTTANMKAVTGFDIEIAEGDHALQTKIDNVNNALVDGVQNTLFGTHSQFISPQFYISSTDSCSVLGHHTDGGEISLGIKEYNGYKSIYSACPGLPTDLLRNILSEAGVHVYSESNNDVIYSNSRYIALHSVVEEDKTIHLKGNYAVYDEFAGKYLSLNTNVINYHHLSNDTKVFRLDPVGGVVLPRDQAGINENESNRVDMAEFAITTAVIITTVAGLVCAKVFLPKLWRKKLHEN